MSKKPFKNYILHLLYIVGIRKKIVKESVHAFLEEQVSSGKTLDVGGHAGNYKQFFSNRTVFDKIKGEGVDIIGDAHDLSVFPDNSFDTVLCIEALQYFHSPYIFIKEAYRVLKPGGKFILTVRFMFPICGTPNDFYRFTRYGLEFLLKDFEIISLKEEAKTMSTFAILIQRLGYQVEVLGMRWFKYILLFMARMTYRSFDFLITKEWGNIDRTEELVSIMPSGYYVVVRKPISP